ncbi:MAG: Peptidase M20D, amidohydrolase [uncultured Segetibacter sp.]|uniref:Peptidase M20D, amidohydrolase n=1 Tax=uncultured Segetibacter sp. TaxID=481133 RepID=A0A6J4TCY9_9BACT|nr:MAG: Peptidase M20D, amidohydrolase [uncultured Segetibacter sp.]
MRKRRLMFFAVFPILVHAQNITAVINHKSAAIKDSVVAWRRHLHQYPELSNREFKTSAFIVEHLQGLGLEIKRGVAKTGVVAILKGERPGPVVAIRADMDALPVAERVNIPFASKVTAEYNGQKVGVMHACGHDSHVAVLLGTVSVLSQMKKDLQGTVVFIFQPAEEGSPEGEEGGAKLMVKEGVLDNPRVDAIFGLHINSVTEVGFIKYKSGSMMASADAFTIKVKGKQTHGSQPWLGVDPIMVSAQIIQGLQTVVSRQSELTKAPVVISVGAIHSGVRFNIIPEETEMIGTIRTLDAKMRLDVFEKIKRTATSIAESAGATAEVKFDNKTLVTYNSPELLKQMLPSLELATGKGKAVEMEWVTGAEDFSFFGQKIPSLFFYLGGMPKGQDPKKAPPHHTPDFYIDDSGLDIGIKAFCQLVFDYGKAKK